MVSDYDLSHDALVWQPPPPERAFPLLASLANELIQVAAKEKKKKQN
jgi:hypothetical protein